MIDGEPVDILPRVVGANSASTPETGLAHQALIYSAPGDFVDETAPLLRAAIARGDSAFVATKRANVDALREELGDDAATVAITDTYEWLSRPYDRLQEVRRLVSEVPAGQRLLALGEPRWDGSPASRREWARYESIINVALADAPLRFVCLYDGATLPDDVLEYATCTHPERIDAGDCGDCAGYVPPPLFRPGAVPRPPASAPAIPVEEAADFRAEAARAAVAAGLAPRAVDDFVLAANEIATNALVHGRRPVHAHVWRHDGVLVCRVADAGPGIADPLAGWLPPPTVSNGGWGLVLARQLCEAVETARDDLGNAVLLHFPLGDAGATRAA